MNYLSPFSLPDTHTHSLSLAVALCACDRGGVGARRKHDNTLHISTRIPQCPSICHHGPLRWDAGSCLACSTLTCRARNTVCWHRCARGNVRGIRPFAARCRIQGSESEDVGREVDVWLRLRIDSRLRLPLSLPLYAQSVLIHFYTHGRSPTTANPIVRSSDNLPMCSRCGCT